MRGVGSTYCFYKSGKLRRDRGLLYGLLRSTSRRDWHLAALCLLCKGGGESRLVCLSVCLSESCRVLSAHSEGKYLPLHHAPFFLLPSSPVDALLTPSGPNMKSGLSLATAAALVAVLLSSVDAQGRKTAAHSRSHFHALSPLAPDRKSVV